MKKKVCSAFGLFIFIAALIVCCKLENVTVTEKVKVDGTQSNYQWNLENGGFSDEVPTDAQEWYANWIWDTGNDNDSWVEFRKKIFFDDENEFTDAQAKIAADSKYWLYVNGELVVREGGLKRGQNKNSTYYDTVDLSAYLQKGENTIAILVWYWGTGRSKSYYTSGRAAMCFQMECDGRLVLSDESWKVNRSRGFSNVYNQANYRLAEKDIVYNAATMEEGWFFADYDDSGWENATVYGKVGDEPWGELIARPISQWKDYGLKEYENNEIAEHTTTTEQTTLAMQIPYNVQFTPYLKIRAKEGDCITIKTDEYADNNGNSVMCTYYAKDGVQEFESPGWMNGEVVYYEIPAGVEILSLQYRESGYDCEFEGEFQCNDDFYNTLWEKARRTLYVNMRDTYMDCPNRERAQWWGDTSLDMLLAMYCLDRDADALYTSGVDTYLGWQEFNIFFTVAPAYIGEDALQLQNLWGIIAFGEYYQYTGDMAFLEKIYEPANNYLQYWSEEDDGLYTYTLDSPRWDWGDSTEDVDYEVLENAWVYYAFVTMKNIGEILNKEEDVNAYEHAMEKLKNAFQVYWTEEGFMSEDVAHPDERANAIAVLSGIADESQYDAISHVFEEQYHATPFLEYFVETACCEIGRVDLAQTRMKRQYEEMIVGEDAEKTSTLWEYWKYGQGTSNHAWSGGPLVIMSRDFAGVKPTSAGYETYEIIPQMGELTEISCSTMTVKGDISVSIEKTDDSFEMQVGQPEGIEGVIAIPRVDSEMSIWLDENLVYEKGSPVNENGVTDTELGKTSNVGTCSETKFEQSEIYLYEDEEYIYFHIDKNVQVRASMGEKTE